ncbi:MAG: hypothetical protein AAFQ43_03800 [Bacteroidota bacterium]
MKYSLLLLVSLLVGCESSTTHDIGLRFDQEVTMRSYISAEDMPRTADERKALGDASRFALRETERVLQTSATWQEADGRLQALASEQDDPVARRFVESAAAYRMLSAEELKADDSPKALDATGRYVEALVRHQSMETPLIAGALERLTTHWPAGRVADVARGAVGTVEAHALRNADCDGCSPEKAYSTLATATRENRAVYDVRSVEAVEALRALASGAE